MRLPGPLEHVSLLLSFSLASAPMVMGVLSVAEGNYAYGAVYFALGVLMFVLPEYVQRQLPGPREFVRRHRPRPVAAAKRRLLGRVTGRPDGASGDHEKPAEELREIPVGSDDGSPEPVSDDGSPKPVSDDASAESASEE